MNLTVRDRIEKGLDREGLISLNNDLDKATNDYRGLIYIEAKEDCTYTSMSWEKYLDGFIVDGKQISMNYANRLIKVAQAKTELSSENFKKVVRTLTSSLDETEAHIMLPESERTCQSLKGDNAKQLLNNWNEIREATGEEIPTSTMVREFNRDKSNAETKHKEEREILTKGKMVKTVKKIDPFTFDEEVDFETWCIEEHGFDVVAERPKHTRAIYALKDENVSNLFGRLDEWKSAYKAMAKVLHPDQSGDKLAYSFLMDFKELMSALDGIKKVVDYDTKVKELRVEYSAPKQIKK